MKKSRTNRQDYQPVDASPVKSFFVNMLTRDIGLEDAILDLLDNSVDGILRAIGRENNRTPYDGYWADINFDADHFKIADNCGGIPWDLHEYAFRMGRSSTRPADVAGTVGVYGIGMKRALFKLGTEASIQTRHKHDSYKVEITADWIEDEEEWMIPVTGVDNKLEWAGTVIEVMELTAFVKERFSQERESFESSLRRMVSTHYAFIMEKGFKVKINGDAVEPRPTRLIFDRSQHQTAAVTPYIFRTEIEGVKVFLAVGFTRPIPSIEDVQEEQEETKYSSIDAGWTVLCNDRAVLYCDRSELTGWGEAGIPRYHTQFIAISGIVEFTSDDPAKLPTTTTKRGIDASSAIYLRVKNKMREGMGLFIQYTNKWKGRVPEAKKHLADAHPVRYGEIKQISADLSFKKTHRVISGEQYKPSLPMPSDLEPGRTRISFTREQQEVEELSDYLFGEKRSSSDVGEQCFELILEEALR